MSLGILKGFDDYYLNYAKACEELGLDYEVIDIISDGWIDRIKNSTCEGFLHRPAADSSTHKECFDSRLFFINKVMKQPIYPDFLSTYIYESKKNMHYWLEINNIPHAETHVFYNKSEALKFIDTNDKWPILFKPNVGSAAIGIKFLKNKGQAKRLVKKIFTKWKFYNKGYTPWYKTKYGLKMPVMYNKQYDYVEFQEKLDVKFEWRMIHIGKSYFGHQKLEKNGLHSGSGLVGWERPPEELLNLVKHICELGNFDSMDVDVFEDMNGNFFVNELQAIFGSYNPSQMYIDGKPGRFVYENNEWVFEEGIFCQNASNNLRVESFAKQLGLLK